MLKYVKRTLISWHFCQCIGRRSRAVLLNPVVVDTLAASALHVQIHYDQTSQSYNVK